MEAPEKRGAGIPAGMRCAFGEVSGGVAPSSLNHLPYHNSGIRANRALQVSHHQILHQSKVQEEG